MLAYFQKPRLALLALSVCTIALTGCAKKPASTNGGSVVAVNASQAEINKAVDYWGKRYERSPKDKATGMNYAQALRLAGRHSQAIAVMRQLVIHHATDNEVLSAYGKAQADGGQLKAALETIRRAQRDDQPDWKLLSAEGAILDQLGRPNEARALYRKALDIKPNAHTVMSNLGMSYVLEGDLKTAETYLRAALKISRTDSRIRQNLALVIGLQGRFSEAEQIAKQELSAEQAAQNIAYLRATIKQSNSWEKLKSEN